MNNSFQPPIMHKLLPFLSLIFLSCVPSQTQEISSFDDCAAAGNPVMESYPMQCRTPDGRTFVQDIGNELEKMNLIRVDTPRPGGTIDSSTVIKGEARGTWYFEADFPVVIEDTAGNVLFTTHATAQDDWMTEDFVPFTVNIKEADFVEAEEGTLVLKKDNPSGLPENDDELRVPVKF